MALELKTHEGWYAKKQTKDSKKANQNRNRSFIMEYTIYLINGFKL